MLYSVDTYNIGGLFVYHIIIPFDVCGNENIDQIGVKCLSTFSPYRIPFYYYMTMYSASFYSDILSSIFDMLM